MGFVADESDFNFDTMVSAVNQFDVLKERLQKNQFPHDIITNEKDNTVAYLAYPSIENVKCVVEFNKVTNVNTLYGDNFISMKKLSSLAPIEIGLSGEDIADRIAEDEWENYPEDKGLAQRCENFFVGMYGQRWDIENNKYGEMAQIEIVKSTSTPAFEEDTTPIADVSVSTVDGTPLGETKEFSVKDLEEFLKMVSDVDLDHTTITELFK